MKKHTAGPWKYLTNVGPTQALILESDGTTVVAMYNRTQDSRFESNVRLMARSPDLLHALHDMIGLAEEAIALRKESDDPEDKEMLPVYIDQWKAARAVLKGLK